MIDKLRTTQRFFLLITVPDNCVTSDGDIHTTCPIACLRGAEPFEALVPVALRWLLPVNHYHQSSIPAVHLVWGDVLVSVTLFSGCICLTNLPGTRLEP